MHDNGNKFFKNRKLYKNTFVEDYLSRNNRALNNFMTRMFILAPNLTVKCRNNPRFITIREEWRREHEGKSYETKNAYFGVIKGRVSWIHRKGVGLYVIYYIRLWNKFLKEYIDDSDKKFASPFKKGEKYNFKLKAAL